MDNGISPQAGLMEPVYGKRQWHMQAFASRDLFSFW
jgi:hypothetical protein